MSDHNANQNQVFRPNAAAKEMGISKATLWRIVRRGELKTIKISQRATGIRLADINAYLDARIENRSELQTVKVSRRTTCAKEADIDANLDARKSRGA